MKRLLIALACAVCVGLVSAQGAPTAKPAPGAKAAADSAHHRRAQRARDLKRRDARAQRGREIEARPFGRLADGTEVKLYRLQSPGGLIIDVSDYGGRLVRCYAPDKFGNLADVTLGWNTPGEYEKLGFSMGTLIGRYGNRIAEGKFTLDGKEYQLPINEDKKTEATQRHCNLHGGPKVTCRVTYKVYPNNIWSIDYYATTDKPTVLNLTHHSYWNLAGESSGNVLGQELQIFADQYTTTNPGLIPLTNACVKATGFDFTELRPIGAKADLMKADKSLACTDNWYDHNFVLRGENGKLKQAVLMRDPVSGRTMEIWTTEPCMQMYGAQNMTDAVPAKAAGKHLCQFAGVALETQHAPDSPNRPDFPSTVLRPGETFRSRTEYRFGVGYRFGTGK